MNGSARDFIPGRKILEPKLEKSEIETPPAVVAPAPAVVAPAPAEASGIFSFFSSAKPAPVASTGPILTKTTPASVLASSGPVATQIEIDKKI